MNKSKNTINTKIAEIKKKVNRLRKTASNVPTSQDSQGADGPHWTLTKIKRTGYPENFSLGAKFASKDDEYAQYYLIDGHDTNGNGWGITDDSIEDQIESFVGKPFVITSNEWIEDSEYEDQYDHPYIDTNNMQAILKHQEKFRVGNIVKVAKNKENGRWYAAIKIDQKFANRTLPQFCSPAIYQINPHEPEGSISQWTGLHLAGLDGEPAYGNRVALLRGVCKGGPNQCMHQFRMGKQKNAQEEDSIKPIKQQGQSGISDTMCDCDKDKAKKLKARIQKLKSL